MNLGPRPGQFQMGQQTPHQAARLHGYGCLGLQPLQLLISQMQRSPERRVSSKLARGLGFGVRGMGSAFAAWEAQTVLWGPVFRAAVSFGVCPGSVAHTAELVLMK